MELMRHDKKAVRGFTFVLDGPRGAAVVNDVPPDVIASVLDRMPRTPVAELVASPAGARR
jgi:5-deoxy-5-amino-3-dehydroquinate synthase